MGMIKIPEISIDYFKSNLDEIFETGNFAEGKWNKELSQFVKELTGANISICTNSNGAGIVALLSIYRHYKNRNTVLIQTNTMYGVKTMVPAAGCELGRLIDCQLESLMPSLTDVKKSISKMTNDEKRRSIILLSHIGGIINPDMKEIADLCKNENIILLEDCAHSFGATLDGKHSGLFGDAGVYSFYATKAIPAGEGGVIVTNDLEIGEMILKYSIYDRIDQKLEIGNNIRISEVQALLSFSVIKQWQEIINNKIEIAEQYIKRCTELNIDYINQYQGGQRGNYYKFIIITPGESIKQTLPNIRTTTSSVYDYSIGVNNSVADHHLCLPIWYEQDMNVTEKVLMELNTNS